MANTQAMCTSFMGELLVGGHQLGSTTLVSRGSLTTPTTDTLKAALYLSSSTLNASTTAYSSVGEVSGTNYTPGGINVTNATGPAATNSSSTAGVAYWTPSASLTFTSVTLTTPFNTVLLYNSTQSGKAISVHVFGDQTVTAGTFTLTMPSNSTSTALIRLATT